MSILEIKDLKKRFGKVEVLKGVSISMNKGEVISLIGSSGSGKTTLLRCINFLEKAESGTICLNGETIFSGEDKKQQSQAKIREHQLKFGFVFQNFNLFPQYSVIENIMLAPKLLAKENPNYKENKKQDVQVKTK